MESVPSHADTYVDRVTELIRDTYRSQRQQISEVAGVFSEAIKESRSIWAFGCTHAAAMAAELYYRAGGLIPIKGIFGPGLWLDQQPVTRTSYLEGLEGYGKAILSDLDLKANDVAIVISTSGRNAVPIEVALECKAKGLYVLGLTSVPYSKAVYSRHSSGKRLFEVVDSYIDNGVPAGDALLDYSTNDGSSIRACPGSTVTGAVLLNAVVAEVIGDLIESGFDPPVFVSGNLDGGTEQNRKRMETWSSRG